MLDLTAGEDDWRSPDLDLGGGRNCWEPLDLRVAGIPAGGQVRENEAQIFSSANLLENK